jgi:hypothetical protein
MIELEGKWLAVWLSLEEVFSIFGFGPLATGSSEVWMVAGRIVGESCRSPEPGRRASG